jgi:hypothetical protein
VHLPQQDHDNRPLRFEDQVTAGGFARDRHDLDARGLYLDMPAWGYHVFDITEINDAPADAAYPPSS